MRGIMLLWVWLIATTLVIDVKGQRSRYTSSCTSPGVDYVRSDTGETLGLITLKNPGGRYSLTVTLHTELSGDGNQNGGGVKLHDYSNGRLQFLVQLPSQRPRSVINAVSFNGRLVCDNGGSYSNGLLISEFTTSGYRASSSSFNSRPINSNGYGLTNTLGFHGSPILHDKEEHSLINRFRETANANWDKFDVGNHISQPDFNLQEHTGPEASKPMRVTNIIDKKDSCGVITNPKSLAFGGEDTERGDWPWLAALVIKANMKFICGSSIISRMHVITAAHCMFDIMGNQLKKEDLAVGAGKYNISDWFESDVQFIDVRRMLIHDDFDQRTLQNDITILLLAKQVEYSIVVRPLCLWTFNTDPKYIINKNATMVGWGRTEKTSKKPSNIPQRVVVPIVETNRCAASHLGIGTIINPDFSICAGAKNGVGPCDGDSGSALSILLSSKQGMLRWYLRGIVSFSPAGIETVCDLDNYSVYTDAAKYTDWIRKMMELK